MYREQERVVPETKFMIPTRPGDFIPRERVASLLARGADYPVLLLTASAGFGKTSALGDYLSRLPESSRPLWLSLDGGEDDPGQFWYHAALAFGMAVPSMEDLARTALSHAHDIEFFLAGLINRLSREPGDYILVLDDMQQINHPAVLRSLAYFIEHLPGNIHLILSSRTVPPLPLSRWRARGWLGEVTEEDLRFSGEEARRFLLARCPGADPSLAGEIVDRTEGWIVGLRLAQVSLQRGAREIGQVLHGINGRDRFIEEYLDGEIFDPLDEDVRLFLLSTSVADVLTGELCDFLTGREDSEALLSCLGEISFFLIPLGEEAFRYHHLFREYLIKRLKDESPRFYRELRKKAALWYGERADATRAIDHLLEGEAYGEARDLILNKWTDYIVSGDTGLLLRFIGKLPEDLIRQNRSFMVWYAWTLAGYYRTEEAEKWLYYLSQLCEEGEEDRSVRGGIAAVRSRLACTANDKGNCLSLAARALELMDGDNDLFRADLEMNLAGAYRYVFDYAGAVDSYLRAAESAWAVKNIRTGLSSSFYCSWIYQDMGRMAEARRLLAGAEARWGRGGNISCWIDLGRGHIDYEEGDLLSARDNLELAREKASRVGDLKPEVYADCSLALVYHALGEEGKCEEAVERVSNLIACCELDKMADYAGVWIAHLRFLQGCLLDVSRWIARNPVDESMAEYREWAGLIHLEMGAPSEETEKLRQFRREFFQGKGLKREFARDMMVDGVNRAEQGDFSLIPAALEAACESGSVAVAAEQLGRLPDVKRRGYLAPLRPDYRERLRAWLERVPGPRERNIPRSPELYEQLSAREVEILELMEGGESNREIGGILFISPTTVKWHVKNILGKLNVTNRTAAVTRGRELGLL